MPVLQGTVQRQGSEFVVKIGQLDLTDVQVAFEGQAAGPAGGFVNQV